MKTLQVMLKFSGPFISYSMKSNPERKLSLSSLGYPDGMHCNGIALMVEHFTESR